MGCIWIQPATAAFNLNKLNGDTERAGKRANGQNTRETQNAVKTLILILNVYYKKKLN